MRSGKGIVRLGESGLESVQQIQFQDNKIASRTSDKIKGQEMNLKRESTRNSQSFKEVIEHVNTIYDRKIKCNAMKHKLDQKPQLSTSSMRIIEINEIVKSEDKTFKMPNGLIDVGTADDMLHYLKIEKLEEAIGKNGHSNV